MRKVGIVLLAMLLAIPSMALAKSLEAQVEDLQEEIEYLWESVDRTERHTATDRITFTGDFRTKADSLHYQDVTWSPALLVDFDDFGAKAMDPTNAAGFNTQLTNDDTGEPLFFYDGDADPSNDVAVTPLSKMMAENPDLAAAFGAGLLSGVMPYPLAQKETSDVDNDILYTTRLRLNMKAKVYDNVNFSGRLAMYKNWGDSTGSQVFDSWRSFTMDGTNGGNTTGDWLRVERAYFDWKEIGGSNFYLSIGRRPSTYGPPSQYRENEMRGGTPSGHLVHFNFDGMTIGYKLGEITGIEGQTVRFCYGQGFESQYGNGELFNDIATKDTHLGGFNLDLLNDGTNFLQATMFMAKDVTDGFKGNFAFPSQLARIFAPTMWTDMQNFPTFNFVTRYQPSTVIGDIYLGGLGFAREEMNGVNYFLSGGWTRTDGNGEAGMFGGMNSDAVFEAELNEAGDAIVFQPARATEEEARDGYSIYAGVQVPAPMGKFGVEYNYGSKFWSPFTQAQDDVIGSKLATRGHVGEAYYIFDVNPRMFIKLGGIYYDYEYSGSGSPVGTPQNIDEIKNGTAFSMLPVVDTAWDANAALTIKF